jgi:hypothetical protein
MRCGDEGCIRTVCSACQRKKRRWNYLKHHEDRQTPEFKAKRKQYRETYKKLHPDRVRDLDRRIKRRRREMEQAIKDDVCAGVLAHPRKYLDAVGTKKTRKL